MLEFHKRSDDALARRESRKDGAQEGRGEEGSGGEERGEKESIVNKRRG